MAQRVQAVPNPRYATATLETTGATIVSTRRVMVPPVIQGTFKGQRDYSGSNLNYIQFQIADNECFMDNKCLFFVADLFVYGPNARDNSQSTNARTYGRDLDIVFDQTTSAIFTQLTIGSPQGLKFEEILQYNMWANIIALHTESALHKERSLLNYSEWSKDNGKDFGLSHFTDQQWRSPCRIKIGERTRVAVRLDFSDFMQNIDMFPLFLLRNGLQITMYLESAYKVFYSPHGSNCSKDIVLQHTITNATPAYIIGVGAHYLSTTGAVTARDLPAGAVNTNSNSALYFSPNYQLSSMRTSTAALVPTFNTLWLSLTTMKGLQAQMGPSFDIETGYLVPVSMYEGNQIVWSGFFRMDAVAWANTTTARRANVGGYGSDVPTLAVEELIHQYYLLGAANKPGAYSTKMTVTYTGTAQTDTINEGLESTAYNFVPQLDVDKRDHMPVPKVGATTGYATIVQSIYAGAGLADEAPQTDLNTYMTGVPLFSFHDTQYIPYVNYGANPGSEGIAEANNTIHYRGGRCVIHAGDAVKITFSGYPNPAVAAAINTALVPVPANSRFAVCDPTQNGAASMLSLWDLPDGLRTLRYQIENPQLLLDLVKPGAQEFMQWQQAFSSPSGIPIKFKKPIYRKLSFATQTSGLLQVQVPINVRSLTGIVFVLQDPALDTEPNDLLNCLALANLSTFQNRRLTEQYIQVGGQQYPVYMYQMRPDGTGVPYWEGHILESEKFFSVAGSASFNASLSRPMMKKTRNMLTGGWLGSSNPIAVGELSHNQRCTYTDASGCVYAMNLAKDWVRTFTTGIDSSQAGSIAINLYFKDPTGVSNVSSAFGPGSTGVTGGTGVRTFNLHMFALCDAVATLQETANLVRY